MTTVQELRDEADAIYAAVQDMNETMTDMKTTAEQLRDEARRMENKDGNDRVRNASDYDFYIGAPKYGDERPYVLPFGKSTPRWNVDDVENFTFGKDWLGHAIGIVCQRTDVDRTRPSRLIFTSGSGMPADSDKIGNVFLARHDQTGAKLGVYEIVGLVFWDTDGNPLRKVGNVPDVKYALNTYK